MIAIVDYGVGNLFSLESSFAAIGEAVTVTADPQVLRQADKIILPGVGAFADAAQKLRDTGLGAVVTDLARQGKPLMGICLGMQLLFEESHEFGVHRGLGLLPGRVVAMEGRIPQELKIPHIGWNGLHLRRDCPLLAGISQGDHVYFVHSFYAENCDEAVVATTEYGREMTAAVALGNICGCQFHPEKSGNVGLRILKNFAGGPSL